MGSHKQAKEQTDSVVALIMNTLDQEKDSKHYFVTRKEIAAYLGLSDVYKTTSDLITARINAARSTLRKMGFIVRNKKRKGYRIAQIAPDREAEMVKCMKRAMSQLKMVMDIHIRYINAMEKDGLEVPEAFKSVNDIGMFSISLQKSILEGTIHIKRRNPDEDLDLVPSNIEQLNEMAKKAENVDNSN